MVTKSYPGIGLLIGILAIGWFGQRMIQSFTDVLILGGAFGTLERSGAVIVKKEDGGRKSRAIGVEWRKAGEDAARASTIGITVPYYDSLEVGDTIPVKFPERFPGRVYSAENSSRERGAAVGFLANIFCFFSSIVFTLVAYAAFKTPSGK